MKDTMHYSTTVIKINLLSRLLFLFDSGREYGVMKPIVSTEALSIIVKSPLERITKEMFVMINRDCLGNCWNDEYSTKYCT